MIVIKMSLENINQLKLFFVDLNISKMWLLIYKWKTSVLYLKDINGIHDCNDC